MPFLAGTGLARAVVARLALWRVARALLVAADVAERRAARAADCRARASLDDNRARVRTPLDDRGANAGPSIEGDKRQGAGKSCE